MADIAKVKLPNNQTYTFKDEAARQDIEDLKSAISGGIHYVGTSTTAITDGGTENPTIDGTAYTNKKSGDLVIYSKKEFIWTGTKWEMFGDMGSLKALAFKDSASGSFTPSGSVTSSFTGTSFGSTGNFTPSGTVEVKHYSVYPSPDNPDFPSGTLPVATPVSTIEMKDMTGKSIGSHPYISVPMAMSGIFSGTSKTVTVKNASNIDTDIVKTTGTANYTPEGTVSTPTITVTPSTGTVKSMKSAGSLPSTSTASALNAFTVSGDTLTISNFDIITGLGSLPQSEDISVATGITSATSTQPTFTGTGAHLKSRIPANTSFSGSYTPSGDVGVDVTAYASYMMDGKFTGTSGTVSVSGTPTGSVSSNFTGSAGTVTVS